MRRRGSWALAGAVLLLTGKVIAGRPHWADADQNYLDGQLDDIRVWNRALSDTDVSDLYNATTTTGPALRWDMDEGTDDRGPG
jgi:hypothetical protein